MKKRTQRLDVKLRILIDTIGATLTLLGLGGLAGASEGQGSFIISLLVFLAGAIEDFVRLRSTQDIFH